MVRKTVITERNDLPRIDTRSEEAKCLDPGWYPTRFVEHLAAIHDGRPCPWCGR